MRISEIMTTEVVTVHPGAPLSVAARKFRRYGISALPVVEEGVLVGMITAFDLKPGADAEIEIVADHMNLPVISCHENDSLEEVQALLQQHGYQQVPVLGTEEQTRERLVGIVSQKDLERASGISGALPQAA